MPVRTVLDAEGKIVPSEYAKGEKAADLDLIGWLLERDDPLHQAATASITARSDQRSTATARR